LVCCFDLGQLDPQADLGNNQNGCALFRYKELPDPFLRGIELVSRLLLRRDDLALECGVWPPSEALAIEMYGLSKQLIPVADQILDINAADFDRPEPSPPVSSRRYALLFVVPMNAHWRGSINFFAAVARAIAIVDATSPPKTL
jgi:hypothetical protein